MQSFCHPMTLLYEKQWFGWMFRLVLICNRATASSTVPSALCFSYLCVWSEVLFLRIFQRWLEFRMWPQIVLFSSSMIASLISSLTLSPQRNNRIYMIFSALNWLHPSWLRFHATTLDTRMFPRSAPSIIYSPFLHSGVPVVPYHLWSVLCSWSSRL